jgi:uncharacterized protein YjeT (DUF2065 family)
MRVAVFVFGILIVLEGVLILVKPQVYAKAAIFFSKARLMYIAALLKIAVGVFLLISMTDCEHKLIITILGLIAAGSGVTMFGMGKGKLKKMFEWWSMRPKFIVRFLGIVAMAIGGLIIYAAGMPQ